MSEPWTEDAIPTTDKIATALAKAQEKITSPPRNREVEVVSKRTGGRYTFKYATLDSIIDHVRPSLTENGLWFTQTLESGDNGKYRLVTTLLHSSGQTIRSETPLLVEDGGGNQAFGSALTYMRRYSLTAMLGVAADEDDDANTADGNTVESQKDCTGKSGATKAAKPKADKATADMKAESERIKKGIDDCANLGNLNAYMVSEKNTLAKVKEASDTAYDFLMVRANKRRGEWPQDDVDTEEAAE